MDKNTLTLLAIAGGVAYLATRTKTPTPSTVPSGATAYQGSPVTFPSASPTGSGVVSVINTATDIVKAGQTLWDSIKPSVAASVPSSTAVSVPQGIVAGEWDNYGLEPGIVNKDYWLQQQ